MSELVQNFWNMFFSILSILSDKDSTIECDRSQWLFLFRYYDAKLLSLNSKKIAEAKNILINFHANFMD